MWKKSIIFLVFLALAISACAQPLSREIGGLGPEEPPAAVEEFIQVERDETAASGKDASLPGQPGADVERLVIKNADLVIVVDDPAQGMADIVRMAEGMGGFVVSSNLYQTELESGEEAPEASIMIRVPAERFNEALSQIEKAANRVMSSTSSGQDVTQDYTDLQSRLRNLEDAEEQLRTIMDEARRTEDVLAVFNQLTQVREQIEVIKGQIQYYEQSAAFSAISVNLLPSAAVQPLTIGGWEPVGVAKNALQALINTLQVLVNAVIWAALLILPVLLIILIPVVLIWRGVRNWRRRRQARLAASPEAQS